MTSAPPPSGIHDHPPGHGRQSSHADKTVCADAALTPGRQRILDALNAAGKPVGAYELIDRIASATGKRPAPISVYRALDFLVEAGLAHRLASRNAFMACGHAHSGHDPVAFLICDTCGQVVEASSADLGASLARVSDATGFQARSQMIELTGQCAGCRAA